LQGHDWGKNVRLLLTGASGFLGRHVLHLLQREGVAVWTIGRRLPAGQSGEMHISCDLLADDDLAQPLRQLAPSHLLHMAWVTDPTSYQISPLNGKWTQATQRLARAFGEAGGRHLVGVGSCAEYDWSFGWCDEETTDVSPATPYGVAKATTRESLQAMCATSGIRFAWGRVFFPFGPGQASQRLIPSLVSALRGQQPAFATQALQRRDFVSAADVALALWTLLRSPVQDCYNISSASPIAVGDLVRMLARLLDADPQPLLAMAATNLQQPELVAGDNRRLQSLGWHATGTLSDGLSWYLKDVGETIPRQWVAAPAGGSTGTITGQ